MYPGVPLVSEELFYFFILAIPKSVILIYPFKSNTRFYGLISLWIIFCEWMYSSPETIQATKNSILNKEILACVYENTFLVPIWYLRSPPGIRSIAKYKVYLSWKA